MKAPIRSIAFALALLLTPSAWGLGIYALTTDNRLLVVDAAVPQNVLSIRAISGLTGGEIVLGIDVRPANGLLYAITDGNRLYTINGNTAAATLVAVLVADPTDASSPFTALNGARFAVDFNPVADRLRVVSDTEQNLRINADTGLVITDGALAYAVGDVNEGANPNVRSIAYVNNVGGVTSLFGIDDTTFQIVLQNPPNGGTLNSHAAFGLVNAVHAGLDVAADGTAYVCGVHMIPNTPVEYVLATVDLDTGDGESHGPIGDGTIPIADIAVAPTLSFTGPHYAALEDAGSATITVRREGLLNTTATVGYTTFSESAAAGSDYTTATGILSFGVGESTKTFEVPIIDDPFPELDETVGLFLSGGTGPDIIGAPGIASLRISANDRPDVVGPRVERVGLTGPSRAISGAVVHFNEDLDAASATNLANYKLTVIGTDNVKTVMAFTGAVYDPVERRVTLSLSTFMQTDFKKVALRVKGGLTSVTDTALNRLDGDANGKPGGDFIQIFKVFSGTTLNFVDADGDAVTLTLTGGGRLDGIRPVGGPATQHTQFWIVNPISLVTSLNGTVARKPRGDGIVIISEIIGLDKKEFFPIASNPAFVVGTLTFSPNATGL